MEAPSTRQPKGRPRAFDVNEALDKALGVFWRKGYEGASLQDLTQAMGINRPSMYAAFGNKEALFRKALNRYLEFANVVIQDALNQPTSRQVVERLLCGSLDMAPDSAGRHGCLLVQGALACSDDAQSIHQELAARRMSNEIALRGRFERAVTEGDLPSDADPADLAKFVTTLQHGFSVQLNGGATPEQLKRVAQVALQSWPTGQ